MIDLDDQGFQIVSLFFFESRYSLVFLFRKPNFTWVGIYAMTIFVCTIPDISYTILVALPLIYFREIGGRLNQGDLRYGGAVIWC